MTEPIPEPLIHEMAALFRLLADPSRLAILRFLMAPGEQSVGQIVAGTGREQANVSKHLKLMAQARFLSRRKDGVQVLYRVEPPWVEQVCRLVSSSILAQNEM